VEQNTARGSAKTGFRFWKISRPGTAGKNPETAGIVLMVAVRNDLFPLTARRAEQENLQLTRIRIKFANHLQLETAAFETGHRESPERTACRGLWRLIIFPALKPSCGIHTCSL
jgi:hypothetical protein